MFNRRQGLFQGRELAAMRERMLHQGEVLTQVTIDPTTQDLIVHSTQDVEPILEWNKEAAQVANDFWGPKSTNKLAARVPLVVLEQWAKERGISYRMLMSREGDAILKQYLNDPENRSFRIWQGHLGPRRAL